MIKNKEQEIRAILNVYRVARDSDAKLLAIYWRREIRLKGYEERNALVYLSIGELSSPESITRCRRKIQEVSPELRGTKWKKRHSETQDKVVDEIQNWGDHE